MNIIQKVTDYRIIQGGHCETGGVASIVTNHGFDLSEPMAFGISSGITFFYMPLVRIWNNPLISFRMAPGAIVRGVQKRLGMQFVIKRYKDKEQAMKELDELVDSGQPVGLQVCLSYLTYFHPDFRVYFNAHTIIIYGRDGDEYLVSDPAFDKYTRINREPLIKARFAKGVNAPRGFMFYPVYLSSDVDYKSAIKKAVKSTVSMMLQPMLNFVGIRAINTVARRIEKMHKGADIKQVRNFLTHIVLFQEEIGTGGGGFRYMYAAFLQEAFDRLKIPSLLEASKMMVGVGDLYRKAAVSCAKIIREKQKVYDLKIIADQYRECARAEKEVYLLLKKIDWR
ncbi:MAG: BtrH N-terminal domain-containing protein [Spirochaetes bacterium]|nr:BtrH N-terminal domain-containing protein [Spirochaetota bacterium]